MIRPRMLQPRSTARSVRVATAMLAAAFLSACGDDPSPVEPDLDITVQIEPGSLELELGDTATLALSVRDKAGNELDGRNVKWTSSDPAVASVDAGRVTAISEGSVTIQAEVEGERGEATVVVVPWSIEPSAVAIDSTSLRLVSDEAELARGTFRFERLDDDAPTIDVGAVIVGLQGGGFLRRVSSVESSGTMLTLETEPAALVDVVRHGSFETTVDMTSGSPSLVPGRMPARGEVLWGPAELVEGVEGVELTAVGLDLSGIDFCHYVDCPEEIKHFKLAAGRVGFDPNLEVSATIEDYSVTAFEAVATGELSYDFSVLLEAEQSTSFKRSTTLAKVQRVFYAQVGWVPVVGVAQFEVKAGFEAKATIKGLIQAGFESVNQVSVGGRYAAESGWEGVLDGSQTFDAHEPSLSDSTLVGQIELEAKVSITPELKILFYNVAGPFVNVEPYGKATLSFGTESCKLRSVAGIDTKVGFTISVLDPKVGTFEKSFSPFEWPGLEWDCPLGHLDVSTITNGQNADPDGYRILVDGKDEAGIASTGSALVEWVRVGTRTVSLAGVAEGCTVEGGNARQVDVEIGLIMPVDFVVNCGEDGEPTQPSIEGSWSLTVDVVCTGPMTVTQAGATFEVSGSIGGALCPFSASGSGNGTLDGNSIAFGIAFGTGSDGSGSGLGEVQFTGTIGPDGNTMSGTYTGARSGQWSAVRQ